MDYNKLSKKELVKLLEKTNDTMTEPHCELSDETINKILKLRSICLEMEYANIGFTMYNPDIEKGTLHFNVVEYSFGGKKYSDMPSELTVQLEREKVNGIYYDFRDIYNFIDDKIIYIRTQHRICNLQLTDNI